MNYAIDINHELKIIRYTHSGIIKDIDIEDAWTKFLSMEEFTTLKYDLLSDYRKGKFDIHVNALPHIIEFMRAIEHIVRGKKQALIVEEAYSVAASMLFQEEVNKEIGFKVRVFSTEESALFWLKS